MATETQKTLFAKLGTHKLYWLGGLVILLIIFLTLVVAPQASAPGINNSTLSDSATDQADLVTADPDLTIETQLPGDVVVVAQATIATPSWIIIYEDNDGALGNILGAGHFLAGEHQHKFITLLRGMSAGRSYYAAIAPDNGNRVFDLKADLPQITDGKTSANNFRAEAVSPWGD